MIPLNNSTNSHSFPFTHKVESKLILFRLLKYSKKIRNNLNQRFSEKQTKKTNEFNIRFLNKPVHYKILTQMQTLLANSAFLTENFKDLCRHRFRAVSYFSLIYGRMKVARN